MLLDHVTTDHLEAGMDDHLVSLVKPFSFEAEQYRRLRQRIEDLGPTRGLRVIAVTSAVAGDGKTVTAINLAGSLAQAAGARILLIDADLRRPCTADRLGLTVENGGWPAVLDRPPANPLDGVRTIMPALDVLLAGGTRADSYELLRSPRFLQLVEAARRAYDYVVLDTPPIVAVPDSSLLHRVVDGYLLVVAADATPRTLVGEALNQLAAGSVIGLVFNRDKRPLFGYQRSYVRSYFKSYAKAIDRVDA